MANSSSGNFGESCITTTTVIRDCINPLEKFLNSILSSGDTESIERLLDKGLVSPDCHCCPCPEGEPSLYFLGSIERFLILNESFGGFENATCCSEFNDAINEMKCHLDVGPIRIGNSSWPTALDYILEKGIVEFGLINGESQLPFILEWYNSNINFLQKKKIQLIEILEIISNKGLVLSCNQSDSGSILASVETYFKAVEAIGINLNEISETCCINIFGNASDVSHVINILNNGIPAT
jgi:hypothetical protein